MTKINTTVRSFEIGYVDYGDGSYRNVEEESIMITSDMNFVDIDFYVTYQVTDPLQYMYATEKPELILKNLKAADRTLSDRYFDSGCGTSHGPHQRSVLGS